MPYYDTNFGGTQGNIAQIPNNPIPPTPQNPMKQSPVEQMMDGRDNYSQAGVQVNFHTLNGVRLKFHVHTINIDSPNQRYDFDFLSQVIHDRIVGFFITSDQVMDSKQQILDNELKSNILHSEIQLTIDNNEIIPAGSDAALFANRNSIGFYDNMYRINERANASQIKGYYKSGSAATFPTGGYKLKLYFWCTENPK